MREFRKEFFGPADRVLSACGRFVSPEGKAWLDIPIGMQYQKYLPTGSSTSTEEKLVETPTLFVLKAFQAFSQPASVGAVYWRLRLPTGRYLQSNVCAASQEFDFGSFRQTVDPPVECEPGSRFYITTDGLTASAATDVAISVLLEGVLRYTLRDSSGCARTLKRNEPWSLIPPFTQDPNQNILAPEWRLSAGQCGQTPAGYRDELFTYVLPSVNAVSVPATGIVIANQPLFISADSDFVIQAFNFISTAVGGASGTLFVRIRDDSGYDLTDGFCFAARLSTVAFPSMWMKTAGRGGALFFDYMFVDNNSTGSFNVQPVAIGMKRWRTG